MFNTEPADDVPKNYFKLIFVFSPNMKMVKITGLLLFAFTLQQGIAQNSAAIMHNLLKLKEAGAVLYVAAHPDDENTRLLSYLANEKKFRTAYLSLTRGDGGQNLIGGEQGVKLGIIRTHELFEARKIDGAEQFFTRAYDFGYSKSPEESFKIWGKNEILEDMVRVIRLFKPDIIITRFPTTGEGGHGHHTASAILAGEAFAAAADPAKFPNAGKPWQAKALYWNAFNFGSNNTTRPDQIQVDIGQYNALLGSSYGELASKSRSMHKSQGFGVPMQRGKNIEYFKPIAGDTAKNIFDFNPAENKAFEQEVEKIISNYNIVGPSKSLPALVALRKSFKNSIPAYKLRDIDAIIFEASGIYADAVSGKHINTLLDKLNISYSFINRNNLPVSNVKFETFGNEVGLQAIGDNEAAKAADSILLRNEADISTQPWLPMDGMGRFMHTGYVADNPYNVPITSTLSFDLYGETFTRQIPVVHKSVDPVNGEVLKNSIITYPLSLSVKDEIIWINKANPEIRSSLDIYANTRVKQELEVTIPGTGFSKIVAADLQPGKSISVPFTIQPGKDLKELKFSVKYNYIGLEMDDAAYTIAYSHIPEIIYQYPATVKLMNTEIATAGKKAAYISGAGDKVPEAMRLLGYSVHIIEPSAISAESLKGYDVVVAGIRAYNVQDALKDKKDLLLDYVKNGGVYVVQYNTNNQLGGIRFDIGPYPFTISRKRITDEQAAPVFKDPGNLLLNYPNKITEKDFDGWEQERSVYEAENADSNYQRPLAFADEGDKETDGSLISVNYGKGRFIYTGLAFFRQLPAAVPGAYKLFANLIAKPR